MAARGELGGGVAVTVMSNYGFHRAMAEAGIEVAVTQVGDRYVLDELRERGWALGGEQSGHIIDTRFVATGDGIAAALATMRELGGRDLAAVAPMEKLPQTLVNVEVADREAIAGAAAVWEAVEREGGGAAGAGAGTAALLGTEPLVRVMVEAPSAGEAGAVCERLVSLVRPRARLVPRSLPLLASLCAESSDTWAGVPAATSWSPGSRSSSTAATTRPASR